jgi:hypothetical protein
VEDDSEDNQGILLGLDFAAEFCLVVRGLYARPDSPKWFPSSVLSAPFPKQKRLSIMAFVWVTMIGSATAYKRCALLGMSFVVERFPKKIQAVSRLFPCLLLILPFC